MTTLLTGWFKQRMEGRRDPCTRSIRRFQDEALLEHSPILEVLYVEHGRWRDEQ